MMAIFPPLKVKPAPVPWNELPEDTLEQRIARHNERNRQQTAVQDAVNAERGCASALGGCAQPANGRRFNVWEGRAVTLRDATTAMKRQSGRDAKYPMAK